MYSTTIDGENQPLKEVMDVKSNIHCYVSWPLSGTAKLILGCRGSWLYKDGQWMV